MAGFVTAFRIKMMKGFTAHVVRKPDSRSAHIPMATTAINVTYVDNELYIIAIPSTGMAGSEIFHYVSGYTDPMNVTIVPQHVLSSGSYTLSFVGINWGGPAGFKVSLTTNGVATPLSAPASSAVGVVWTANVAITV